MKQILVRASCTLLATIALAVPTAFAQTDAAKEIAMVITNLNHFPTDEQKESLQYIKMDKDNSASIQTIAGALINLKHRVSPEDKALLEKIAADSGATDAERQLASILMNIQHKPDPDALAKLKAISQ